MQLSEIRSKLVETSGRLELVKGDNEDNGANYYIQSAIRLLDGLQDHPESRGRHFATVASGSYYLTFQNCRVLEEVWVHDSDGKYELYRRTLRWIKNKYGSVASSIQSGLPKYYAPNVIRPSEPQIDNVAVDYAAYHDKDDLLLGDSFGYKGIYFMPPSNASYTMQIIGKWFSKTLTEDTDKNYWSEVHPELVLDAALNILEGLYRNTEGWKDYLLTLQFKLRGIDHDLVDEESSEGDEMERSW